MFRDLPSVPNLPQEELKVRKYWEEIDAVELLKKSRKNSEKKYYIDGPITANNMPHYGHAITWTLKDVMPRYWSMKGFYVSRNMGWDCQGIPVEYEVEKTLGFSHKKDIENYGVAKFNQLCKESVFKYRDIIFDYEKKLGRWFDDTDVYYTMDKDFIESMWWSLAELHKKGLLYEGHKVVGYSTRAGTPLSSHEVAEGGYAEIEDPAVTIKFKLKSEDAYLLAWTTTPWTLPGNLMLAVGKHLQYVKVLHNNEFYILASDRVDEVFKNKEYKVVQQLEAKDLIGQEYTPIFDYFKNKTAEGCFKVVHGDHVNIESGTGIVHLAPYGAEDFDIFMNLGIKLFDYLDATAVFTNLVPEYEGLFYKDANPKIINDLTAKNVLFNNELYTHRVAKCWRTDTPLIYKPIKSWYLAVTKIKDKMVKHNQNINWVPNHIKDGSSHLWISNARDWALSRDRYWGTPLPLWINDKTNEYKFIGSFAELEELSGVKLQDPHKPFVDEITWEDKVNGGVFKRVSDVIDVWYDSGSVPFAKLHYPFENKKLFEESIPTDYIAESTDQIRLWFYTMHVLGVALFDKVPYKNVVVSGMLNAKDGKKLSKSKKNFPPMEEVLDVFGADVLRYFLLNSPIVESESVRFYTEALDEVRKSFFITYWNSVKYFTTYANLNNFEPLEKAPVSSHILDKWILTRLQQTINQCNQSFDNFKILDACRTFQPFVEDLSTWYIRRSRDRIRLGNKPALATLFYVLKEFNKLIAPVVPFMSEIVFEALDLKKSTKLKSVHLDYYPTYKKLTADDSQVLTAMEGTREIVSLALSIRVDKGIKVRQPLYNVAIRCKTEELQNFYVNLIKDEVNVKNVQVLDENDRVLDSWVSAENKDLVVYLDTQLTEALQLEGNSREIIRKLQDARKEIGLQVSDEIEAVVEDNEFNQKTLKKYAKEIKKKVLAKSLTFGSSYEVKKS